MKPGSLELQAIIFAQIEHDAAALVLRVLHQVFETVDAFDIQRDHITIRRRPEEPAAPMPGAPDSGVEVVDHVVAIAATEDKVVLPLSTPQAIGTTFTGRIEEITQIGPYPAIVPTISGQGWITGMANSMIDPTDPLGAGFTVSDLWA